MTNRNRFLLSAKFCAALPLCLLVAAGCSKTTETTTTSTPEPAPNAPIQGGGPGGMRGGSGPGGGGMRGGGRGAPIAENASGSEIYAAKCGCHGPEGKGGKAPVLTSVASRSDADLTTIIHDGKGKMPAFGTQLSDAQITKVVAYLKQLK